MLERNCASRRPGRAPYEMSEYVAMVIRQDDARVRHWATQAGIDPARVRAHTITLNHDGGRWLSLSLPGELPAVVREVNGQWRRQ